MHRQEGKVYVYADIGSPHARCISEANEGRNLVIILDHHALGKEREDDSVINVNPRKFGISGSEECSGASVCYLFSKVLNERNVELSYLALVGSKEIPSGYKGLNLEICREAEREGIIFFDGKDYVVKEFGMRVGEIFSKLQILGAVGYYRKGPEVGVKACLHGFDESTLKMVEELEAWRKDANRKLLARLWKEGLEKSENFQWFDAKDSFEGMGSKVVGTFCSYLSYQRLVDKSKYLVGFMKIPGYIPGYGRLKEKLLTKVSARAPKLLQERIKKGGAKELSFLLPSACKELGGFGDGHEFAASGIIPTGRERELIEKMEELLRC